MKYIVLSVAASTLVLVIFRLMQTFGANTRHTITISYLISSLTGVALFSSFSVDTESPWFWPAAVEGLVFYLVFRLMAKTTQVNGIAVAGIATKMSVVIPVSVGIVFLNESANALKMLGIAAGFLAIFLSTSNNRLVRGWRWPLLVFMGTGAIDASLKLFQVWNLPESQFPEFITTIFLFAFIVGSVHHFFCEDRSINLSSMLAGVVLGFANFGTVYFILKALAQPDWESSIVFPINNIGVVAMTTATAVVLFGERLSRKGVAGLTMAFVSIALLFLDTRV